MNCWKKTFQIVGYTVQYNCVAYCVIEHVDGVVMNSRPSVDSTIQNSNIKIFANLQRLLINIFDIQKGDIVIAKSSSDPKSNICKRIIALEGDKTLSNNPSGFFQSYS